MNKTILILGGYGNAGRWVAKLLYSESDADLVIAGRNLDRAEDFACSLNQEHNEKRARVLQMDASNLESLLQAFEQADMVVVASSTAAYADIIAKAAMQAKIAYFDLQFSNEKMKVLLSMKQEIERSGICFITEGGFHPGLPALMVRYAASAFDQLQEASVGMLIKTDWKNISVSNSTLKELADEFRDYQMQVYKEGQWQSSWKNMAKFDFGDDFGVKSCSPMFLEEMRALPDHFPELRETGLYVAGLNWFVDYLIMPLGVMMMKIAPQKSRLLVGKMLHWGLATFTKPPFNNILVLEADGLKDGNPKSLQLKITHHDSYFLTAVPAVACLLQYLDGTIAKPGFWMQALVSEPQRMVADMQRMGIKVEMTEQGV